jgi:hypothetical protein
MEKYIKVAVASEKDSRVNEHLWCEKISDGLFKVGNVPYFSSKLCLDDVIEVSSVEDEYGTYYEFEKVVEHVRQSVFLRYTIIEDEDKLKSQFSSFGRLCREKNLCPEGAKIGFVVVAVPWGKYEESVPVILECAKEAGLDMRVAEWKIS